MERERSAYSSSPPATAAFGPLREDVAELGVVLVLVHVMYADMSVGGLSANVDMPRFGKNVPLQIIGSGVLVLSVWTERTHVAGGLVHETVSDHLVFTLEALPALASRAAFDGAEVRPCLRVDVGVRTGQSISMCTGCLQRDDLLQKVLRLERGRCTVWLFTLVSPRKALWDVCKTGSNRRW